MFSLWQVSTLVFGYVLALFGVAAWAERRARRGADPTNHPWVYSLSLAVYCTAWTYYGSVGFAKENGLLFLSVYLGPLLWSCVSWPLTRKLVRIRDIYRANNVADLLSVRYGKSQSIATIATAILALGIIPYISLQLKAIVSSVRLLISVPGADLTGPNGPTELIGFLVALSMAAFVISYGLRRRDPAERHPGMVMTLAVENLLKLLGVLAAGIFVIFALGKGWSDFPGALEMPGASGIGAVSWFAHLLLSFAAIWLLPRQYHVAVVENQDSRHLRTAAWLFPFYLFLINLFVMPILVIGLRSGLSGVSADTYTLALPLAHGQTLLSLLVFIGGFSAAAGMLVFETVPLSMMITNHLLLPFLSRIGQLDSLKRHIVPLRWFSAGMVLALSYLYFAEFGDTGTLVQLGLISFTAVLQFLPAVLGGLYWREGNRFGATLGLLAGAATWLYTLIVPILATSGYLPSSILSEGLFGLSALKPQALFGLSGLDPISHAVVLSMVFNCLAYVGGSLVFPTQEREKLEAEEFVDVLDVPPLLNLAEEGQRTINLEEKRSAITRLFGEYFGSAEARERAARVIEVAVQNHDQSLSVGSLTLLQAEAERMLAGVIGPAAARKAVLRSGLVTAEEEQELATIFAALLAQIKVSPLEISRKIEYFKEREELLLSQAREREELLGHERAARETAQEAARIRDEFLMVASHELKTPITPLLLQLQMTRRALEEAERKGAVSGALARNLESSESQIRRITRLVEDLLDVSRLATGKVPLQIAEIDLSRLIEDSVARLALSNPSTAFQAEIEKGIRLSGDPVRIEQALSNLAVNAVKFGQGKPVLIRLHRLDGTALLSVSDQGLGIAAENRTRIFDRFTQAVSPAKYGGFGVGLYVTRQIVEAHGGRISVESQEGKGSTFTVSLPLAGKAGTA